MKKLYEELKIMNEGPGTGYYTCPECGETRMSGESSSGLEYLGIGPDGQGVILCWTCGFEGRIVNFTTEAAGLGVSRMTRLKSGEYVVFQDDAQFITVTKTERGFDAELYRHGSAMNKGDATDGVSDGSINDVVTLAQDYAFNLDSPQGMIAERSNQLFRYRR